MFQLMVWSERIEPRGPKGICDQCVVCRGLGLVGGDDLLGRNSRLRNRSRVGPTDELCPRVVAGCLAFAASSTDIVAPVLFAHNRGNASSLRLDIFGAP